MAFKKEVKVLKVADLKDNPKNPNRHPKEQIEDIAKSIDTYGQYYPIVCDENLVMLCGHGKKLALEHLGREEAEVTIIYGMSEKQKMKLLLSDNKIQSMSFIDNKIQDDVIREIGEVGIIGFNDDYINDIIGAVEFDSIGVEVQKPNTEYAHEAQNLNTPPPSTEEKKDAPVPTDNLGQQTEADDDDPMSSFTSKHFITCPHCGETIEI